ncbi:MAG: nuclear transport factor 2 family protein, partial [Planctomycetota bacterium]|nr:nuclear transport factor 2 family protein [Planctomycetota bacterium]
MNPQQFVSEYEAALATQDWTAVEPLMHKDVCVTFSSGAVHRGLIAVQKAFEGNFAAIACENYKVSNIHWVQETPDTAIYLFDFDWTGI